MRAAPLRFPATAVGLIVLSTLLAACQTKAPPPPTVGRAALPVMERIALGANACWFKSKDAAFSAYRLAPELNSFSGRPRILVVHRTRPEARPLLVVQAEGSPAKIDAFGPLMDEQSPRISRDVNRWAAGGKGC